VEIGLADEFVDSEEESPLIQRCVSVLEKQYFPCDIDAAYSVKKLAREEYMKELEGEDMEGLARAINAFHSDEVMKRIKAFVPKSKL